MNRLEKTYHYHDSHHRMAMLKYTNNEYHMGGPFFVLVLLFSYVINILEILLVRVFKACDVIEIIT